MEFAKFVIKKKVNSRNYDNYFCNISGFFLS
jgi:hypothetical protein